MSSVEAVNLALTQAEQHLTVSEGPFETHQALLVEVYGVEPGAKEHLEELSSQRLPGFACIDAGLNSSLSYAADQARAALGGMLEGTSNTEAAQKVQGGLDSIDTATGELSNLFERMMASGDEIHRLMGALIEKVSEHETLTQAYQQQIGAAVAARTLAIGGLREARI